MYLILWNPILFRLIFAILKIKTMKYKKLISFLAFFLAVLSVYGQNPFILKSGEPVTIACGNSEEEVVHTALNLLNRDVESVFSTRIIVTPESKKGMIIVGTIGQSDLIDKAGVDLSPIKNKKEAFLLAVSSTGKLVIAGSDKYNPQIQISGKSGTKRSIFRQKNKTKRSKKRLHTTLIKPEQKVNEDLCSGFIVS